MYIFYSSSSFKECHTKKVNIIKLDCHIFHSGNSSNFLSFHSGNSSNFLSFHSGNSSNFHEPMKQDFEKSSNSNILSPFYEDKKYEKNKRFFNNIFYPRIEKFFQEKIF